MYETDIFGMTTMVSKGDYCFFNKKIGEFSSSFDQGVKITLIHLLQTY